jgi:hypothetical protein
MIDDHAKVILDGVAIPLIGISPDATQEKCVKCGKAFHLQEIDFNGLCGGCQNDDIERKHNT